MNPFVDMEPGRKMTTASLVTALRLDLAGEQEARRCTYMAHAGAPTTPWLIEVLIDIANEERVHTANSCG
jgi:rubrerythrin